MERSSFYLFGVVIALSFCCFALLASSQLTHTLEVSALQKVRNSLKDSQKNLVNWERKDPCTSNWTGVICTPILSDGYLHVQELRLMNMNLSGKLAPELGQFSYMMILNFMWNNISGSIPKEIGNMTSLQLLLLSGNQISGPLPDELGYLPNLTKFQLDINFISGPLPKSFANLPKAKHFHMNNNSISGQIPHELSALPQLIHLLLDNNNLSGYLPPELSEMRNLKIIQLNNNNFSGTRIPDSFANMSKLVKLSLRNCNLEGEIPDLSKIKGLLYLDLSMNQFSGNIPTNKLSSNITTIDLSRNILNGSIPSNFSGLPYLQDLLLDNNSLSGDVPTTIWQNMEFGAADKLTLDFQNNLLSNISGLLNPPANVSIKLQGNPICTRAKELDITQFCGRTSGDVENPEGSSNSTFNCEPQSCPTSYFFEYVPASPLRCFCAAPLGLEIRLRSPSISDFRPYKRPFEIYLASSLGLDLYQVLIDSFEWQEGPRIKMYVKIYPQYNNNVTTNTFNTSELHWIMDMIATFTIPLNDTFGPFDLLGFSLLGPYSGERFIFLKSGMSKSTLIGIVFGAISIVVVICFTMTFVFYKRHTGYQPEVSKKQLIPRIPIKIEGVKEFSFVELELATSSFSVTTQVGQGSYGKVYKGVLADGTIVAIKRAKQGSLQGQKEFYTEIEILSRLHHRNLVSLVGYCDEKDEQMLVYEFMPNGSVHNLLAARSKRPVNFAMRLYIAMGSAKGILYLHTEAYPPIIHRDIKANNILLDSKLAAKVADFGISRLAPVTDGEAATHISTVVKGTPGYVDPEYFLNHKLTEKSDVYSLGVVFLELLTGMQPISHGKHIVRQVHSASQSGKLFSIIDETMGPYPSECVKKFMALALSCCQEGTEKRPSVLEVVRELENISSMLSESDMILPDSEPEASTSGMSGDDQSSLYTRRKSFSSSSDFHGSDLVSGVIPSIRPR
ncbi:probable LRR receptor-like serine/threonine-protein kinase At5g37450 isoform X2 [Manihot esculenta]|nr:probable LRR receptor-like serine/threonine-protein kinase At5g37450 isoform X2 [Manihot esculenta]OAY44654.1 hypothetical protein MANES_08G169000v8 [Manihot esculenta]